MITIGEKEYTIGVLVQSNFGATEDFVLNGEAVGPKILEWKQEKNDMAYIESIKLSNFRNYESLELSFDKGTNIFYGDNAQGKTNILESVYLCGTSKSHKGSDIAVSTSWQCL